MINEKEIQVIKELGESIKKVADLILKVRSPMNSWQTQNAFQRLGEVEYWTGQAINVLNQMPVADLHKLNERKETKFAAKSSKTIANKQ